MLPERGDLLNKFHVVYVFPLIQIFVTSGFWPRVRARALRAPVFLACKKGRCALPFPPITASLLLIHLTKIKN
jgi:hypothetical protein